MTLRTIIDDACMVKGCRRPITCVMANVAFLSRGYMRCRLTGGDIAIVATAAFPDHLVVIDRYRRYKRGSIMTSLANIRRLDMSRRLAHGLDPVVTSNALVDNTGMIKSHSIP